MGSVRNSFFKVLYKSGIGNIFLSLNRKRKRVPVLVFHKIIPEYDEVWPGIHPRLFEEIILLLKKHYTILPLTDLYQKTPKELRNACFITFDDGYTDFLDYAYPILKKHDIPSTLFVLPTDILNNGHIWTSTIVFFVKHYSFNEINTFFRERGILITYYDVFDGFRINLDITLLLCEMMHSERAGIINELQHKFVSDQRIIEHELLSFDQLRLLDKKFVTTASHSLTHPSFKKETNTGFIEHELQESKKIIEKELDTHVELFAFPFAKHNDISFEIVKRIYKLCFTRINAPVDLKKIKSEENYLYDLPRFNIHHDTAEEVFLLINSFHKNLDR